MGPQGTGRTSPVEAVVRPKYLGMLLQNLYISRLSQMAIYCYYYYSYFLGLGHGSKSNVNEITVEEVASVGAASMAMLM